MPDDFTHQRENPWEWKGQKTISLKRSYQVKGMAVWSEQAHRKLQMHWPVQMTHQWLNQYTQLQVKPAMPVKNKKFIQVKKMV